MFNFENLFAQLNSNASIEPRSARYQDGAHFLRGIDHVAEEAG